jgi:hypothetical protein
MGEAITKIYMRSPCSGFNLWVLRIGSSLCAAACTHQPERERLARLTVSFEKTPLAR